MVIMPPSAPYTAPRRSLLRLRTACAAWSVAGEAMHERKQCRCGCSTWLGRPSEDGCTGNEARTALIEGAYLENQVEPAVPRNCVVQFMTYLVATFDQEDATMHKMGTQVDAAIDRVNAASTG